MRAIVNSKADEASRHRLRPKRVPAIARALLLNPKLLLLDEPSQGLAPLLVKEVFQIIQNMRKEGIAVLLVEQNVRAAIEIADRVYVLDDGHILH